MKKIKTIGFELSEEDFKDRVAAKLNFNLKKLFPKKNNTYYLKEFLLTKRNYEIINKTLIEVKTKSMPPNIKQDCKFCNGESKSEIDKSCERYYTQMDLTFAIASSEFISIVLRNNLIYNDKKELLKLTVNFFNCLHFIKGKGLMYFDLDKMSRYVLSAGFLSLTNIFSKSDTLNNLTIINNSLDHLEQEDLQNEILQKEDTNFLNLQIKFLEKKKKFYSAKVFVEEKSKVLKNNDPKSVNNNNNTRPNRTDLAFFIYYTNETKYKILEAVVPSDLAWKEMGGKYNKNWKNIQVAYNLIASNTDLRVSKNKVTNIEYVINNMLSKYPKALSLAQDELKQAELK
jgi:hypothetical protein